MMFRTDAEWRQSQGLGPENEKPEKKAKPEKPIRPKPLPKTKKTGKPRRRTCIAPNGESYKTYRWKMSDEEWKERMRARDRKSYKKNNSK